LRADGTTGRATYRLVLILEQPVDILNHDIILKPEQLFHFVGNPRLDHSQLNLAHVNLHSSPDRVSPPDMNPPFLQRCSLTFVSNWGGNLPFLISNSSLFLKRMSYMIPLEMVSTPVDLLVRA
jgi:hypothetical protein